jgi:hypothetical protein
MLAVCTTSLPSYQHDSSSRHASAAAQSSIGLIVCCVLCVALCRAIEQAGGLDRYLLNTPDSLLQSDKASNLKFKLSNIYWYKQHEQKQQQRQGQQGYNPQQGQQQASQQSVLTAVKAAQRQVLTAGGSFRRPQVGWNSQRGTLLPPAAAAAAVPSQHS